MSDLKERINEATRFVRSKTTLKPDYAIILGTGIGGLAGEIKGATRIPFDKIPNFPVSTVLGHSGQMVVGTLSGKRVVAMDGRVHYYEGYSMQEVTFPTRVMKFLGARTLIVSNAVGGMNPFYQRGDIVIIADHINLMGNNPLIGPNDDSIGTRFPDMSEPYTRSLMDLTEQVAIDLKIKIHKGVFVGVAGPNLETAAEYRFLRGIGADSVGMSTVPEVLVARHMNMNVLGLSVVTDMCLPDALEPGDHRVILKAAQSAEPKLTKIVKEVLRRL
ncbi:MAG TPA: purine-nucleoside phosphorylase [bacterium]|nr:purine-nucleoside phosphorylase [bacterium]